VTTKFMSPMSRLCSPNPSLRLFRSLSPSTQSSSWLRHPEHFFVLQILYGNTKRSSSVAIECGRSVSKTQSLKP